MAGTWPTHRSDGEITQNQPQGGHVTILTGMPVLFWGFEIWPNPIFLAGQIFQLFFKVSQNFCYFYGSDKFPAIFWVFQFLYHPLKSFE